MEEGMNWFGGPFMFDGHERWQLWFDNPNKAAVFLVELALLGLSLVFAKGKLKTIVGLLLFLPSSLAIVQTYSRGGLLAWITSVGFVVWRHVRECRWRCRDVMVVMSVLFVFVFSINFGLSQRMVNGLSGYDLSVINRFDIWRVVPQMMHDAPLGWGLGNSGLAYVNWYQSLDRSERYRTLVSSHLTWFVETGWIGMFVWIAAWSVLLRFGVIVGNRSRQWLCLAQWLCLGIAGAFSSVMESPWLWIIPVSTVVYEAVCFRRGTIGDWFRKSISFGVCCGLLLGVVFLVVAKILCADSRVGKSTDWVEYRGEDCLCWLLVDPDVLGGVNYPRVLRENVSGRKTITFRLVDEAVELPVDPEIVAVCGKMDARGKRGRSVTIWLSPSAEAAVAPGDIVIVGEFSAASAYWESANIIKVDGVADFIPTWPHEISSVVDGLLKSGCNFGAEK